MPRPHFTQRDHGIRIQRNEIIHRLAAGARIIEMEHSDRSAVVQRSGIRSNNNIHSDIAKVEVSAFGIGL